MLRKMILSLAACATIGAAALAPTSASAYWHGGWYGGHHGYFYRPAVRVYAGPVYGYGWHRGYFYRPAVRVYAGPAYGGCLVRRWVPTPHGPALRWINRCS
jgi:hypothetical protein